MNAVQCLHCKNELKKPWQKKFCSNQCQANFRYSVFKYDWLQQNKEIVTKNISRHIKRFLIESYGEQCAECGWNKKHVRSGRVPLEIDHIDGNAMNNQQNNLRLLCPNCHALTPSYRNFNKGNGRKWRRDYISSKKHAF